MAVCARLLGVVLALTFASGAGAQATAGVGGLGGLGGAGPTMAPEIPSWRAPIPADGAFMIRTPDRTQPTVTVIGPTGTAVEGALSVLSEYDDRYYAWKPSAPFALGDHSVTLVHEYEPAFNATFTITVVEAMGRAWPAITAAPALSGLIEPSVTKCCTTPLQDELSGLCATGAERASALLHPNLESTEPLTKLNQFLFRVRHVGSDGEDVMSGLWMPFSVVAPLQLIEAADELCVSIDALDITTDEVHTYSDLARCIPRGDVAFGETTTPLPAALLTDPGCLQPPFGRKDEWCAANRPLCEGDEPCKLYRYACEGAPLPSPWREMAALYPYNYRDIPLNGEEETSNCSISTTTGRNAWPFVIALGLLIRRSRRRYWA